MRLHSEQERELLGAGRDGELRPGPVQVRLEPVPLRAHPGVSSAGGDLGRESAWPLIAKPRVSAGWFPAPRKAQGCGRRCGAPLVPSAPRTKRSLIADIGLMPELIRARLSGCSALPRGSCAGTPRRLGEACRRAESTRAAFHGHQGRALALLGARLGRSCGRTAALQTGFIAAPPRCAQRESQEREPAPLQSVCPCLLSSKGSGQGRFYGG